MRVRGNTLARLRFAKPIKRATEARLLADVIERARSYNAEPIRLLTVTKIAVFGSYLDLPPAILGTWTDDFRAARMSMFPRSFALQPPCGPLAGQTSADRRS